VKALSPHLEATFMRRPAALFLLLIFSATICNAQRRGPIHPPSATSAGPQSTGTGSVITLPAFTKITVALTKAVFTASAQPGDAIYAVTSFPVVADTRMAIPPGTYVQGFVDTISRPSGHSPHAEFRLHFVQMVFADGYSVELYNTPLPSAASDRAAVPSDPVQQELLIEQVAWVAPPLPTSSSTSVRGVTCCWTAARSLKYSSNVRCPWTPRASPLPLPFPNHRVFHNSNLRRNAALSPEQPALQELRIP
jgi:hypothetical protein